MFAPFLAALRKEAVPVSLGEYLTFLAAMAAGIVIHDPEGFYILARTVMVKDERHLDAFDRAFGQSFSGLASVSNADFLAALDLPPDWLAKLTEGRLTPEDQAAIAALGGFDALMQTLRDRLAEQTGRHQGGSKWIGTAGTSPFGAYGYHPEGVRLGQGASRHQRAAKVWDRREFANLSGSAALDSRNLKLALRRLRRWAREGSPDELDLDSTIRATADHGYLDLQTRPERRNAVKVLLFLDSGGSMDAHVGAVEALFSAARASFRQLTQVYFHNCLYDGVWRDNRRRWDQQTATMDLIHHHDARTRCIFVGDATMAPYEVTEVGGANEHWNSEPGQVWLARTRSHWPASVWLNPVPEAQWDQTASIRLVRAQFPGAMFPLTLDGISAAMKVLGR